MITVNAAFTRRHPSSVEHRCVRGITLELTWEQTSAIVSHLLQYHRPEGDGWSLQGFARVRTEVPS